MSERTTSQERKAEILRRVQAGEKAAHVARDVGVTKQYVSWLVKLSREAGTEATIALRRGRPKEQTLTPEETEAVRARILSLRPADDPTPGNLWRADEIKSWFRRTYGRTLSIHQLRRVCTVAGLRLAPSPEIVDWLNEAEVESVAAPDPKASGAESTGDDDDDEGVFTRKRGRPRKSEAFETTRMSDRMMQEILKANAEAAQIMERARQQEAARQAEALAANPVAPVRLGPKIGRNDPCPFDPTIKFKRCCGAKGAVRCTRQAPEPPPQ